MSLQWRAERRLHHLPERRRRSAVRALGVATAVALAAAVAPLGRVAPAGASTFTVTDLADGLAPGTLRWAIESANAAPGPDEIDFDPSLSGTTTLTGGPLRISDDLAITNTADVTISGGGVSGVFDIDGAGNHLDVTLTFVRVADGSAPAGGAISAVDADVHVVVCVLSGNSAIDGGAIAAADTDLTVVNTLFQNNQASGDGGAIDLQASSSLTMSGSNLVGNSAAMGGGILVAPGAGPVTISGAYLASNSAAVDGGGMAVIQGAWPITLQDVAVANNTAGFDGGGIAIEGTTAAVTLSRSLVTGNVGHNGAGLQIAFADAPVSIQDTTITANSGTGLGGGVIALSNTVAPVFDHVTVAGNSAIAGGGVWSAGGRLVIANSIVADNAAPSPADIQGLTFDLDHSLVEDAIGATFTSSGFDVLGTDPRLGPLGAVPGFAGQAFFPGPASPANDSAGPSTSSVDQRGAARPAGPGPDMGAIEVQRGVVAFTASAASVAESAGSVALEVGRADGSELPASVDYAVAPGTSGPSDYSPTTGTLTWADGDTTPRTILVPVTDDATHEGDETFVVALSAATGAPLGVLSSETVTIVDDDAAPPVPPGPSPTPPASPLGYVLVDGGGAVHGFGDAAAHGDLPQPVSDLPVALERTPSGDGYWVLDAAGHVFAFGDATWQGNAADGDVVAIVGHAADGYWTVARDGRVVAHGSAPALADVAGTPLDQPIVDAAATASGEGLYLVAADGGVFALGDATFGGSAATFPLVAPIVGVAVAPGGRGYWLAGADGGVFAFGTAPYGGSAATLSLNAPIRAIAATGVGYVLVADDGGVFDFSGRPFGGSLGSTPRHGVTGDA